MSYINFKEETYKCNLQLQKRSEQNESIIHSLLIKRFVSPKYTGDTTYSFKTHTDFLFGAEKTSYPWEFVSINNTDILCATFIGCKFYNIKYSNCNFIGCYFINCDFGGGGVVFENCNFLKDETLNLPSLNIEDNLSCTFTNCNFYAKFLRCNLGYAIFNFCNFKNTNCSLTDLTNGIITSSTLDSFILSDCNLSCFKVLKTYMKDFSFRDKEKSKIDENTFIDKIPFIKKTRDEYEGIYSCYENIGDKFKENNLTSNFGEYYYLAKCTQRRTLNFIPKIGSYIVWITCGYGERPSFSVYSSFILIIIFAIIYLFTGFKMDDNIVSIFTVIEDFSFYSLLSAINETINLSTGMFAGIGFNNCNPIPINYFFCNLEMLAGVVMTGLGIATLTKKSVR